MNNIENLKEELKKVLDATENTETIQQLAAINNIVCAVENEQNDLLKAHSELKQAYKEAIMSAGSVKQIPVEDVASTKAVDFDTMLQSFIKK